MRLVVLAIAAAACGGGTSVPIDGHPVPDAFQPDAHTICDPTAPFGAPVAIAELNSASADGMARFSPTETTVYFDTARGGSEDIYSAHRVSASDPFDPPAALANINSQTAFDGNATISENGNLLVFDSDRVANEGAHLYSMQRNATTESFTNLQPLDAVNSSTTTDSDRHGFLSADLQALWFASDRAGGAGNLDIYRATAGAGGFANPVAVSELESADNDGTPVVSGDQLTVYFSTDRPGGSGGFDIWTAHRPTTADAFPAPTPVSEIDSASGDYPSWLSLDNCRLYLMSDRDGPFDIYVATR